MHDVHTAVGYILLEKYRYAYSSSKLRTPKRATEARDVEERRGEGETPRTRNANLLAISPAACHPCLLSCLLLSHISSSLV